jgi:hypothetical protein
MLSPVGVREARLADAHGLDRWRVVRIVRSKIRSPALATWMSAATLVVRRLGRPTLGETRGSLDREAVIR